MTLTRAKLLHAGAWGVLIILLLFAKQYGPIDTQPWQGILIAVCAVLAIGLIVLATGVGIEKPDERAHANVFKANSMLLNGLNILLAFYLIFGNDEKPLTIPYEYVLLVMALINVFQDLAFLYYERRNA